MKFDNVILDADEELVIFSRNTFWTSLFVRHFLEVADDALRDDMLFYVRKFRAKSKSKTHQVGLCDISYFNLSEIAKDICCHHSKFFVKAFLAFMFYC